MYRPTQPWLPTGFFTILEPYDQEIAKVDVA